MENIKPSRYAIFTKMIHLGKSMRNHCHKAVEDEGFTLNETDVLLSLASGNCTVKEISMWSSVTKSNISTAVESLRRKGFVKTETSKLDRRSAKVTLTDNANRVLEKLRRAEDEFFSSFTETLSKDDETLSDRIFNFMQKISIPSFLDKLSKKDD